MLEMLAISALLTAAGKKVFDSLASKAVGQMSDAALKKLEGDPAHRAFERALGETVHRYATTERLYLARPLLEEPSILTNSEVANELANVIGFQRKPNASVIAKHWKAALPDAPANLDFDVEARLLLSYLEQALRGTDVFRPAFEAKDVEAIAATTAITSERLAQIAQGLAGLRALMDSAFGEMSRTFAQARPIVQKQVADFTTFIEDRTRGFVGREFVFEAFDKFKSEHACGYYFVSGDPGIGKSAISAQLVRTRGYVHHFNIRAQTINTTAAFVQNVCAQLIAVYSLPYSSASTENFDHFNLLDRLLRETAAKLQGDKVVIIIDGLDEVDAVAPGVNPLGLPTVLPEGIIMFVTMRKDTKKPRVDGAVEFRIDHDSALNTADVRKYLEREVSRLGIRTYIGSQGIGDAQFIDHMVMKSEGNFIYLRYVIPEIEAGAYKDLALQALPTGLRNYYEDHWDRMRNLDRDAWLGYKLPIVMALTRVKKPVSIDLIAKFSGVEEHSRIRTVLQDWGQFLHQEVADDDGRPQKRYRIYHESFFDFIAELDEVRDSAEEKAARSEGVSISETNKRIADVLWQDLYGTRERDLYASFALLRSGAPTVIQCGSTEP